MVPPDPRRPASATIYSRFRTTNLRRRSPMPRGLVPRQPAKTGCHEGARTIARGLRKQKGADGASARDLDKYRQGFKRPENVQLARAPKSKAGQIEKGKRYDLLAPERIQEILR